MRIRGQKFWAAFTRSSLGLFFRFAFVIAASLVSGSDSCAVSISGMVVVEDPVPLRLDPQLAPHLIEQGLADLPGVPGLLPQEIDLSVIEVRVPAQRAAEELGSAHALHIL